MMRSILACVFGCALAAGAHAQEAPRRGGTLTIALSSDVRTMEPGGQRDFNTDMVMRQIFEGLVAFKTDLSVGPALAESWTISPDGLDYRFKLRDGVTFHNGQPLTSREVVWSWERLKQQSTWSCRQNFDGTSGPKVEAVEADGADTVVFRIAAPSGMLLKQMANIPCSVVVWHPESTASDGRFTPIATGPLKLKEWRRDQYVALERFDGYKPSAAPADGLSGKREIVLDAVRFQVVPDANAALAALRSGAIDILPNLESELIEETRRNGMQVMTGDGLTWHLLALGLQEPLLKDIKIRQAIAHAIDIKKVAELSTAGLSSGSFSAVSPITEYYDEQFAQWLVHDPKKAAALLKESSYKGEPLRIQTTRSRSKLFNNAIVIQQMLAEAGFNAQLDVMEWSTQLANYLNGKFQLQTYAFSPRMDPSTILATFLRDSTRLRSSLWDNPEALRILAFSMETNDESRRKEAFLRLQAMMREAIPLVPLYFEPVVQAARPNVRGFSPWAGGSLILDGVWKAP